MNRKTREPDMSDGSTAHRQFVKLLRAYVAQHWPKATRSVLPNVLVMIAEPCDYNRSVPFFNYSFHVVIEGEAPKAAGRAG